MSNIDVMQYALYAMDSYNSGPSPKINNGSLQSFYSLQNPDGFYAEAYECGDKVVISYRGTDVNNTQQNPMSSFNMANDIIHGYETALGLTPDQSQALVDFYNQYGPSADKNAPAVGITGLQSQDALDFYNQVAALPESEGKQIVLTGQSLGGGLAGYVSMATGATATVFEPMPFVDAAINSGYSISGISNISSYAVDGEMLQLVRDGTAADIVQAAFDVLSAFNPALAILAPSPYFLRDDSFLQTKYLGNPTNILGANQTSDPFDFVDQVNGGIEIHGQSLMIMDLYGQSYGNEWTLVSKGVFHYLLMDSLASSVGVTSAMGLGSPSDQMMSMIAYTTQSGGFYGDLAAVSLFSDMTKLGQVSNEGGFLSAVSGSVSEAVATYVETAALNHWTTADHPVGIVTLDQVGHSIDLNFHDPIWTDTAAGGAARFDVVDGLVALMLQQDPEASPYVQGLAESQILDVMIGRGDGAAVQGIGGDGMSEIVGTDGNDYLSGYQGYDYRSNQLLNRSEIIFGGAGNDTIIGNGGYDVLIGGNGNDTISGSDGAVMLGGSGNDVFKPDQEVFGHLTIDGGPDTDTLDMSQLHVGVTVTVTGPDEASGEVGMTVRSPSGDMTVLGVEKVVGTLGDDVFYGAGTGITFDGGSGNDVFHLKAGDVGIGGPGTDVFYLEPGAVAIAGSKNLWPDNDQFHFVLDDNWTSITSAQIPSYQGGSVYLDWGGNSIQVSGLPTPDYYHPNPSWEIDRIDDSEFVLTSDVSQSRTLMDANGAVAVQFAAGQFMSGWSDGSLAPYGSYSLDMARVPTVVSGNYLAAVATATAGIGDARSGFYGDDDMVLGTELSHIVMGSPTMQSAMFEAGHSDPVLGLVGPVDGTGAALASMSLNDSEDTAGVALIGGAGYVSGSYDSSHSNENLTGGFGNDLIVTGTGSGVEDAFGGDGRDFIIGRGSNQLLSGGDGDDFIAPGAGSSVIDGGSGFDMASYHGLSSGITVSMHNGFGTVSKAGAVDSLSSVEVVVGTTNSDVFSGGGAGTAFVGDGGGDVFNLSGSATAVAGGGGNVINVKGGSAVLLFGLGSSDVIDVDGVRVTGSTHGFSYEQQNKQADGSYDLVEHMTVGGSIGSGQVDTLLLHYDGTAGTSTAIGQILADSTGGDSTRMLVGDDESELIVNKGGMETDIFIAGYRDGVAGIHSDSISPYVTNQNASGVYMSRYAAVDDGYGTGYPTDHLALTHHQVTDAFGF